ncbi:MAG: ABC transporter permease subunit [Tissierellia bacterium]|nr:ABC transporter permease subunit [Bacillota bacterium]NLL22584.1 ABC transporter permease subunit [Tissierellia bacterium]
MKTPRPLLDDIGNVRERKNLYLKELFEAEAADNKEEIRRLKAQRSSHTYNLSLEEARKKEAIFLKELRQKTDEYEKTLSSDPLKNLKSEAFAAAQKYSFYQQLSDLSYDFSFLAGENDFRQDQLPRIIANQEALMERFSSAEAKLAVEKSKDHSAFEREAELYRQERKAQLQRDLVDLKAKQKQRIISDKAFANEKKMAQLAARDDIRAKQNAHPVKRLEEEKRNLRYRLKNDLRLGLKVLESDISDLRRKTPIEIEQSIPWKSFLSIPLPGLGQLLNGQWQKGIFFFIASAFIYLAAIPYALGYANYQGTGISGLITLAEGGARLHRSIIFMVEGIIAIFLLIFAAALFIISFRDTYETERRKMHGIRPFTWFESRVTIEEKGFPYLVTLPALIVTVFIILVPIMTTILISFTNMDPNHQSKFNWIGIANYKLIALGQGIAGSAFWLILGWTLIWTLGATTLAISIGFILSLLVNQERLKGKKFFRTVFLLPWAVPAFITIMFFSIMVSSTGPITQIIKAVTGQVINIKNSSTLTRIFLIFLQGWLGSAYIFLLSTGVLQGIPSDLYEAAEIDGATSWQKTMRITVPLILFQTAPLLVGQYTFNFNNFSIIFLFNQGGPFNPSLYGNLAGSTDILISYIYKLTIQNQYQGIGAAITIVISVVLMFVAWLGYRNTKAFKEE